MESKSSKNRKWAQIRHEETEREALENWHKQENSFYLQQRRQKALVRAQQGRSTITDWLVLISVFVQVFIHGKTTAESSEESDKKKEVQETEPDFSACLDMDLNSLPLPLIEPWFLLQSAQSLEELNDIEQECTLLLQWTAEQSTMKKSTAYWEKVLRLVQDQSTRVRGQDLYAAELGRNFNGVEMRRLPGSFYQHHGVSQQVLRDVFELLDSQKTSSDKLKMMEQVKAKLEENTQDVEYWELLQRSLMILQDRQEITQLYRQSLQRFLSYKEKLLKQKEELVSSNEKAESIAADKEEIKVWKAALAQWKPIRYATGSSVTYSLLCPGKWPLSPHGNTEVLSIDEFERLLPGLESRKRTRQEDGDQSEQETTSAHQSLQFRFVDVEVDHIDPEKVYKDDCERPVEDDEEIANPTEQLHAQYLRPVNFPAAKTTIRPKIHTRIMYYVNWSRYNRIHYNSKTNPPPKNVFGYKFTLYYPPCPEVNFSAGQQKATYKLKPHPKDPEKKLIEFRAPAPYETVVMEIVDGEWEVGWRRGLIVSFERGLLRVWFHYKRIFYRR